MLVTGKPDAIRVGVIQLPYKKQSGSFKSANDLIWLKVSHIVENLGNARASTNQLARMDLFPFIASWVPFQQLGITGEAGLDKYCHETTVEQKLAICKANAESVARSAVQGEPAGEAKNRRLNRGLDCMMDAHDKILECKDSLALPITKRIRYHQANQVPVPTNFDVTNFDVAH